MHHRCPDGFAKIAKHATNSAGWVTHVRNGYDEKQERVPGAKVRSVQRNVALCPWRE
jgi:hypothetical protein